MCTTTKMEAGKSAGRLETIVSSDWIDPAEPPITTISLGCNRSSPFGCEQVRVCAAVPRVGHRFERGGCKESQALEARGIGHLRASGIDQVCSDSPLRLLGMTEVCGGGSVSKSGVRSRSITVVFKDSDVRASTRRRLSGHSPWSWSFEPRHLQTCHYQNQMPHLFL